MGYISLFFSFIFFLYSVYDNKKKIIMPKTLFYLLWTFILLLSNLNLYNITRPSNFAYYLILTMLIFFLIGDLITKLNTHNINSFLIENKFIKNINKFIIKIRTLFSKKPKFYLIYILSILFIFFTLIDCYVVIKNLMSGVPMYEIRHWRMGSFGIDLNPMLNRRTFVEEIFRSVILVPFETLLPPIAAYCFFNKNEKKKHKYFILILSLIVLILSSIAGGGGRLGFIYYFGSFLLMFLVLLNKKSINYKKHFKFIILILFFGFICTILLTKIRTTNSFIKQVYTYFALPPTLLSLWLPEIVNTPHTYGLLSLFGMHSYVFRGLDAIGLNNLVPNIYYNVFQHVLNAENFLDVGYGTGNAFVTPIYYFMIDGGIPFVCIASLFLGFILSKVYNNIIKKMDIRNFVIYVLIMYGIFLTFIRIQTVIPAYIISFIFAFFLLDKYDKKEKKVVKKNEKK